MREVYAFEKKAETEKKDKDEEKTIPEFKVGEKGPHKPLIPQGTTRPPKPYTEATLLRATEPAGKQVPHKPDDLVVIVLLIALLDGGVVLVDDDNGRNDIVLVQHRGQVQQC